MRTDHSATYKDELACKILRQTMRGAICEIGGTDLAPIFEGKFSDSEKRNAIQDFARHYGLLVVVDYGLSLAVFR